MYTVDCNGIEYECVGSGKIKLSDKLFVGDIVDFDGGRINFIVERKNLITRPNVANIDILIIVISNVPKPDFLLVDKLLINCRLENITPIICINKLDILDSTFIKNIKKNYAETEAKILITSAKMDKGIKKLKKEVKNKLSSFCGQSAVGKTSILNCLGKNLSLETGELSKKTDRGKHTTRTSQIFKLFKNTYITDTPGFSKIDLERMDPERLSLCYPEYIKYSEKCKFRGCTHTDEPQCEIKKLADKGRLSLDRYNRYVNIQKEIAKEWKNRYGKN